MLRNSLMIVVAAAVFTAPGFAQQTPDLSGTWKLNIERSDVGPMPHPEGRTDVIEQHGSSIKQSAESETEYGKREFMLTFAWLIRGRFGFLPLDFSIRCIQIPSK